MDYSFNLFCDKKNLKEARYFLYNAFQGHFKCESQINLLIVAIDEFCSNLIIHGHQSNPNENIQVNVKYTSDNMVVELVDGSAFFNILDHQDNQLLTIIEDKKKGGLGILLIKKIMDKIEFAHENTKNIYRLYKKLPI